jgi:8-oxo-dGTP pyrophosphatase MutT (NUDIX family)
MDFHRIKNILSQHTPSDSEWKGAVLFLFNEEFVFLIKRAEGMPTHGGQIAFVGGHKKSHEWEIGRAHV